jgi:flagella synthesis protein FlgN
MDQAQQLLSLITGELTSLEALQRILQQEQQALLAADVTSIEALTAQKNRALDQQSDITRQRQLFTQQHAGVNSIAALQHMATRLGMAQDIAGPLKKLQVLADQCRNLNRDNGRLIQQRQQHTQGALQVLRQSGDAPATYSGRGKTEAANRPRTLGKA